MNNIKQMVQAARNIYECTNYFFHTMKMINRRELSKQLLDRKEEIKYYKNNANTEELQRVKELEYEINCIKNERDLYKTQCKTIREFTKQLF